MKYLVLGGAGLQGRALAFDLLEYDQDCTVIIGDSNEDNLKYTRQLINSERLQVENIDIFQQQQVNHLMSKVDAAINSLPHPWEYTDAFYKGVVNAGIKGVLTDYWEWHKHYDYNESLRQNNATVIPGMGIVPGFGNICVGQAAYEFEQLEEAGVWCGGLPVRKNIPPLDYMEMFIMESVVDLYYTDPQILMDGEVVTLKAMQEIEKFYIPGIGEAEAILTDGLYSLLKTMKDKGVKKMFEKTLRYPGHYEKVNFLKQCGFFSNEPIELDGHIINPQKYSEKILSRLLKKIPGERDFTYLLVEAKGIKDGKRKIKKWELMDYSDEEKGLTSMERVTAYPSSIACQMLVKDHEVEFGLLEPELYFIGERFNKMIEEMAKRGIRVYTQE